MRQSSQFVFCDNDEVVFGLQNIGRVLFGYEGDAVVGTLVVFVCAYFDANADLVALCAMAIISAKDTSAGNDAKYK